MTCVCFPLLHISYYTSSPGICAYGRYYLRGLLSACVRSVHTCVCVCPLRKIITSCTGCHYEPGCPAFSLTAWLQQVNYMSDADDVMLATSTGLWTETYLSGAGMGSSAS